MLLKTNHYIENDRSKKDYLLSISLCLFLFGDGFSISLSTFLNMNIQELLYLILIITSFVLLVISGQIKIDSIFLFILITLVFTINYLFFTKNQIIIPSLYFRFCIEGIFGYSIIRSLNDVKVLLRIVRVFSFINFIIVAPLPFVSEYFLTNYMAFAYLLLPSVIFEIYFFILKKSFVDLLISTIGFFLLFIFGARGPIVAIISFIVFYFLIFASIKKKVFVSILISFLIIILMAFYKQILLFVTEFTNNVFGSSRMINLLISGHAFTDSGRDTFYTVLLNSLKENLLTGIGIGGDRIVMSNYFYGYSSNIEKLQGMYAHNVFLEIVLNYGLIIGGLILITLIFTFLFAFLKCKDKNWKIVLLLFTCLLIIPLFFSKTYLHKHTLLLLGIAINCIKVRRQRLFF